jgi:hypothetical protein
LSHTQRLLGEKTWKKPTVDMTPPPPITSSGKRGSGHVSGDFWEEKFSTKHQRKFWRHKVTGEMTWKRPNVTTIADNHDLNNASNLDNSGNIDEELLAQWEEKFSETHKRKYWKNKVTGESTWKNPWKANDKKKISGSEEFS